MHPLVTVVIACVACLGAGTVAAFLLDRLKRAKQRRHGLSLDDQDRGEY